MEAKNEEDAPKYPNNVEETMYEIAISNTEERIKRIQNRNDELLEIIKQIRSDTTSTDIETADQIAQLNRQLTVELTKINDTQNAINIIERKRLEEKKEHENKVNSLNETYEDVQLKLFSKMKILNAKINALEDFKDKKSILENKFEYCNELMAQREKQLGERLSEINIKFKIDREKLIENLHKKLFELSKSWASDNEKKNSPTVRRLFQENIAIQYELDQNALEMDDKKHHYSKTNPVDIESNSDTHHQMNTMKSLMVTKIQSKLIKLMKKNRQQQRSCSDNIGPFVKNAFINYDNLIDKLQMNILHSEQKVANLKYNLHDENNKVEYASHLKNRTNKKVDKYVNTLYDVKYAIACALQIIHSGSHIASMNKTQFISHLKDLVKNK